MKRGLLVKSVRQGMDLTQNGLSRLLGVDTSMISKWENEVNNFDDERVFELYYICDNYSNLDVEVLFDSAIAGIMRGRLWKKLYHHYIEIW